MNGAPQTYAELEAALAAWVKDQPDIADGLVLGSRARADPPPDRGSDLDVVLFTTRLENYANSAAPLAALGKIVLSQRDEYSSGVEWMLIFENGLKLDVLFASVRDPGPSLQAMLDGFAEPAVFAFGVRPLGVDTHLEAPSLPALPELTEERFRETLFRAWIAAARIAKLIWRAEPFQAHSALNRYLHPALLDLLAWQARLHDSQVVIWYGGRRAGGWAASVTRPALPGIFPGENRSLHRALLNSLDLIRSVAQDIARQKGWDYPAEAEDLIKRILEEFPSEPDQFP